MPRSDAVMSAPARTVAWRPYCPEAPPRDLVEEGHDWTTRMQRAWDRHERRLDGRPPVRDDRVATGEVLHGTDRYGGVLWLEWVGEEGEFVVYRCPVCGVFLRRVEV